MDTKKRRHWSELIFLKKTANLIIKILGVLEKNFFFILLAFFVLCQGKCIMGIKFQQKELCPFLIHFATCGLPTLVFVEAEEKAQ